MVITGVVTILFLGGVFMDIVQNPNVVDIELELLGSLLLKNGLVIPKVADILKPDDFFYSVHQIIYKIIIDLHNNGTVPNILSIVEELRKRYDFKDNETVFLKTALSLGEVAFTTAYAIDHANLIKEKSILRSLIHAGNSIVRNASDPNVSSDDIIKHTENLLDDIKFSFDLTSSTNFASFFDKKFQQNVDSMKIFANRKTGFVNLDEHQIFSPGLYVIGGLPALGKTSFAWQLLEQLATLGESCVFCSYEMSEFELFSKSLARAVFIQDKHTGLTSASIRRGDHSPALLQILQNFKSSNLDLHVLELQENDIDDLIFHLRTFCKHKAPIFVLDYLQIVPVKDSNVSPKQAIDEIVRKLKNFQRQTNSTFIVVSSFNRLNYSQRVSFESFKESGNIEYSADVVWGLQFYCTNQLLDGAISKNRDIIDNAKKANPRQIQLCCLKNRQGINYDIFFKYFPANDCFIPCLESDFKDEESNTDSKDNPQNYNDD